MRTAIFLGGFAASCVLLPGLAGAAPWELNPNVQLPDNDAATTQKLELVDINVDGFVDIVLANSKGDNTGSPADAEMNQVMLNQAGMGFTEMGGVFEEADTAWTIKAGDLDNDGDPDLVVGVNFTGASYVLMNDNAQFTKQMLPGLFRSIGDLELGDVDGDGNLDIFAADWGIQQPYGDPDDIGGPMVLWLGDGMGAFTEANANLPMGMNALSSWTFDLELVDFDNDFDLDAFVSNRGGGKALVFRNDGTGTFELYPFPGLQPMTGKNVNVAFTPIDLNGDDYVDFVTLQDGPGQGSCVVIDGDQICAKRNAVLINDKAGQAPDATDTFWDMGSNPPKLDFDAATLDFNNNGTPDLVLTGLRLGGMDPNTRLLLNSGTQLKNAPPPNDIALPVTPSLGKSFGLMFADFNRDHREDVAVATRDATLPSFVLYGRTDPAEGVPEDVTGPKLAPFEMLPALLYFGKEASGRTRAHDYKTPSHWHDYQYDEMTGTYNLIGAGDVASVHKRRIPYMEFALSLANADDIKALPDGDPTKYIAPAMWYGEALWRVRFDVPYNNKKEDTLTWQWCAIDAAGNKSCLGPFQVMVNVHPDDCGNGSVEPWEDCDGGDLCNAQCENTCGNMVCDAPAENFMNCMEDCPDETTGAEPTSGESASGGATTGGEPTGGEPTGGEPTGGGLTNTGTGTSSGDSATGGGVDRPEMDGCLCAHQNSSPAGPELAALFLLARRRRSRPARRLPP